MAVLAIPVFFRIRRVWLGQSILYVTARRESWSSAKTGRSKLLQTENKCYIALTRADGGRDTGTDGKKDALQVFAALQTEDDKPKETILVASTQASR